MKGDVRPDKIGGKPSDQRVGKEPPEGFMLILRIGDPVQAWAARRVTLLEDEYLIGLRDFPTSFDQFVHGRAQLLQPRLRNIFGQDQEAIPEELSPLRFRKHTNRMLHDIFRLHFSSLAKGFSSIS